MSTTSPLRTLALVVGYALWLGIVFVGIGIAYLGWVELGCPQTRPASYVFEGNPEPSCVRTRTPVIFAVGFVAANLPWLIPVGVRRIRARRAEAVSSPGTPADSAPNR